MAGHVEDRWYRNKRDPDTDAVLLGKNGKPLKERTDLHGKGLRYKVHYYDEAKRERSLSFPDKQLGKAQNFLVKMQHDVLTGDFVDPEAGKMRLRVYAEKWRKGQSQDAGTQQVIGRRLNRRVYPVLGDFALSHVEKVDTVRDWLDGLRQEGLSENYCAQLFDLVSSILSAAKDEKKIHANPCRSKGIKRPKPEERKIIPWSSRRLYAIEEALPERYKVVVPLGGGLALRQMEILGCSLDDIDRDKMVFNVARQIRWIGKVPVFAPPKGGKTREVPIGSGVLARIDEYAERFPPLTVTLPWRDPDGKPVTVSLLINYLEDRPWRGTVYTRNEPWRGGTFADSIWRPAFEVAGEAYRDRKDGMHAMRHFCASHWLAHGVSIKEVAEYLGHHDPAYTLRMYTHLVKTSYERARAAVDQVFPTAAWAARSRPDFQDHGLQPA